MNKYLFFIVLLISLSSVSLFSQELGDVNGDQSIDIIDALLVAQNYVGLYPPTFSPVPADVNCDGWIDIIDALLIAQHYVGLIVEFYCGMPTSAATNPPEATPSAGPTQDPGSTFPPLTPAPTEDPNATQTPVPPVTPIVTPIPTPLPTETPEPTLEPGEFEVIPLRVDFGTVMPEQMAVEPLNLENNTPQAVTITNISLSNTNLASFGSNSYGQLGVVLPNKTSTAIPQGIPLDSIVQIDTFYSTSFFVTNQGALWACGYNTYGQIGDGTITEKFIPVFVMQDVQKVSSSISHTLMLKSDGSLWGCGWPAKGTLGIGDTSTNVLTPIELMASGVVDMATGGAYSFVLKEDNTLWAFGVNQKGQLGINSTTNALFPVLVMEGDIQKVVAGWNHTAVLKTDGSLWTTGQNTDGELGNGTHIDSLVFAQVINSGVVDMALGSNFTLVRMSDNRLLGCGDNSLGQIGSDGMSGSSSFITIATDVIKMDAGALHSLFIKSDGSLWGCGSNGLWPLGIDSPYDQYIPVKLYDSGVVEACGGFTHSIVLRTPADMVYSHTGDYPVNIQPGQSYSFDVILDSNTEGSFGGVLRIETSISTLPVFHIPIWGNVSH